MGRRAGSATATVAGLVLAVLAFAQAWPHGPDDAGTGLTALPAQARIAAAPGRQPVVGATAPRAADRPGAAVEDVSRAAATPPAATGAAAAPVSLRIPELAVDARVESVGVAADGQMQIPSSSRLVGWYEHGAAPLDGAGSVVLAGHVDSFEDGRGVLFELSVVELGAPVVVTLTDGSEVAYRVTGRQVLPKQDLPLESVFAREGPERLVIITCGGPFREDVDSYRDNVVVIAEPVPGPSGLER